jgi:hypothetical protein
VSIIRDADIHQGFEKIVRVHDLGRVDEPACADLITHELPQHDQWANSCGRCSSRVFVNK